MQQSRIQELPATPIPQVPQSEILTAQEVADWLKMSKRQIYEMTRTRGKVRADHPIPVVRINGNIRFRRSDIEAWLSRIAEAESVQWRC
jgi:excisionase family DNA binding protein